MSLVVGEMQVKATVRYHYSHSKMAEIENIDKNKC